jgi:transketolase
MPDPSADSASALRSRAEPASQADVVNAIRALAMDAVQQANSGHPGMPMGMAEIGEVLWRRFLRHNPGNPAWPDRDRFLLSNGHGSMLQYALLHLTGYDLPMEEIRRFRQLHSRTPGHPEFGYTPGVETTTGPLGQGLANAVGFAIAEKLLAAEFNRPGHRIVDHFTYVTAGDGCLMEGISHEACSLAGVLGLGKLIVLYDDNGISIDGEVKGWFRDNTPMRFAAYGWHVIPGVDGHDSRAVAAAIEEARGETGKPTLVCCKTIIGKGSPHKAGTAEAHGAPLGKDEVAASREALGWKYPPFEIPDAIYREWDARAKGKAVEAEWNARLEAYEAAHPEAAGQFKRRIAGELPADWSQAIDALVQRANEKAESVATRKASQQAIEAIAPHLPELLGGSADLTGSNLTTWSGSKAVTAAQAGNYIYFGVREFAMAAIGNGLALHGGFIPYSGTFLTFSDYSRNALRMAALMRARNIFVFSHDSIGLGEDGPTHQAVEHLGSLRLIPHMDVWRPCDTVETAVAWAMAIERKDGPSSLALSRQNVPFVKRTPEAIAAIRRGGYVLADAPGARAAILATGSEVGIALAAQKKLAETGVAVRVVSMPCTGVFDRQDAAWREAVLPKGMPRAAIEAGVTDCWRKYVGLEGAVVGIDRYGESAPAPDVYKSLGIDAEHLVAAVQRIV